MYIFSSEQSTKYQQYYAAGCYEESLPKTLHITLTQGIAGGKAHTG